MSKYGTPTFLDEKPKLAGLLGFVFLIIATIGAWGSDFPTQLLIAISIVALLLLICEVIFGEYIAWKTSRIFVFCMLPMFVGIQQHADNSTFSLMFLGGSALSAMCLGLWGREIKRGRSIQ